MVNNLSRSSRSDSNTFNIVFNSDIGLWFIEFMGPFPGLGIIIIAVVFQASKKYSVLMYLL